jgi:hypothetical protein
MLNPTCTVFTCMSLFTKHNYKTKKFNYLTLRGKSNVNELYVQLISNLSSTRQKSISRFITDFSTCKDAFLKFERHIFYRLGKFDNIKSR